MDADIELVKAAAEVVSGGRVGMLGCPRLKRWPALDWQGSRLSLIERARLRVTVDDPSQSARKTVDPAPACALEGASSRLKRTKPWGKPWAGETRNARSVL